MRIINKLESIARRVRSGLHVVGAETPITIAFIPSLLLGNERQTGAAPRLIFQTTNTHHPRPPMKHNALAPNPRKSTRKGSALVALSVVFAFSLLYGVTSVWRPVDHSMANCTACCLIPEQLGDLEPMPLEQADLPPGQETTPANQDTLSPEVAPKACQASANQSNRPTLAPPPAQGNVGYGPAIEVVVEARQVGSTRE